ncbi:vacuolar sorting protein [Stylonychia lemnae]|uniref:Vacuolar sorting protein n=1 Tax=Stylonychia lemnae TaxID=5949 RepID=A0A078B5I6_STYLE|nr:vacuolar sorting protein [Stylonychia lemnae]|eukprot:CDW89679.1 vacuolar sorting protein [Stylonychia lemnae]
MTRLQEQMDTVEKRIKKVEADMKRLLAEALQKKKQNDNRGAIFALKRKKLLEKEIAKLDGQMTLLESQRMMIETSVSDTQVFQTLIKGTTMIEHISKQVSIDKLEDIKDKLDEQQQDMEEVQDFFIKSSQVENEDELLDELNELEAFQAQEELDQIDIGKRPILVGPSAEDQGKSKKISSQNISDQELDDELKELERLMA